MSSLSKYETDQLSMSLPVLDRIAEGLGIAPVALLLECLKHRYPNLSSPKSRVGVLMTKLVQELSRQRT